MIQKQFDVFISHSGEDAALAMSFSRILESQGQKVWVDSNQLSIGDELVSSINNGVAQSKSFLLLASKKAMSSPYVWEEIHSARRERTFAGDKFRIFIVQFENDVPIPVWMKEFVYLTLKIGKIESDLRRLFKTMGGPPAEEFYLAELLTLLRHDKKGDFADGWLAAREEYEIKLQQIARLIKETKETDAAQVLNDLKKLEIFKPKSSEIKDTWSNIGPGLFELIFQAPMKSIPKISFKNKPEDIDIVILDVSIISARFRFTQKGSQMPVNFIFPPGFEIEFAAGP